MECVNASLNEIGLRNLLIYPNPTNKILNIFHDREIIENVKIYDLHSKIVVEQNTHKSNLVLDVTNLSSGVYFIQIITNNSILWTKFVVQNDNQ